MNGAKVEVHTNGVPYLKEWYSSCGNFPYTSMPICLISNLIAKLNHVAEQTDARPSDNLHIQLRDVYTICMEFHVHSRTNLI